LKEWVLDVDDDGKPFPKRIKKLIDEYNRLEDNVRKAMRKHISKHTQKMWDIKFQLNDMGIFPGGTWTEDGPTGEDYKFFPQAQEKYDSDPKFKAKVDDLIRQYEEDEKRLLDEYLRNVEPPSIEFNKFHNAHWREIAKAHGGFFWPKKDIKPINKIPTINM